ncbi:MAG TPA: ribonuclease E activity regulator RraA [Rubrobacteraceae bacterium]|nr:ribonuclease E activity regulator RraA [Rubrobacteraceae bacterium]
MFRNFGGERSFHGPVATVRVFEDNVLVREALSEAGRGRVLVVDGAGSVRCALVGDMLARLAHENGWAGLVVNGAIRDSDELPSVPVGLKALAASPRRSKKSGAGERDAPVAFAGVTFEPGQPLYADPDGIVVVDEDPRRPEATAS